MILFPFNHPRRREQRATLTAFKPLIATPHNLENAPLRLPAGGRLALTHTAGAAEGAITVYTGQRLAFTHHTLTPNEVYVGPHCTKDMVVDQYGAQPGTFWLYLVHPLNGRIFLPIAFEEVPNGAL